MRRKRANYHPNRWNASGMETGDMPSVSTDNSEGTCVISWRRTASGTSSTCAKYTLKSGGTDPRSFVRSRMTSDTVLQNGHHWATKRTWVPRRGDRTNPSRPSSLSTSPRPPAVGSFTRVRCLSREARSHQNKKVVIPASKVQTKTTRDIWPWSMLFNAQ